MTEEDPSLNTDDSDVANSTQTRMCLALIESDIERQTEQPKIKDTDNDSEEELMATIRKKSKKPLIADSDEEPVAEVDKAQENPSDSEIEGLEAITVIGKKSSRILARSDSESGETPKDRDMSKYKSLIDEDSGSSGAVNGDDPSSKLHSPVPRKKKLTKKKEKVKSGKRKSDGPSEKDILKSLNLSCSSSESGTDDDTGSSKSNSSTSSDEDGHRNQQTIQPREKVKQRMSAKQAIEQMQVIQSESQRMAREASINVPYHKSRSLSLKEFLNRKTNVKHTDVTHGNKSVAAQIKMTAGELKNYAHLLDKREREAQEFFKYNEKSPYDKVDDKQTEAEIHMTVDETQSDPQLVNDQPMEDDSKELESKEDDSAPMDSEVPDSETQTATDIEKLPDREESSQIAVEKPEINYELFDDEKANELEGVRDTIEAIKCYTPFISGTSDEIIDLETGDVVRRPLTGPELLLDQMLRSRGLKNRPVDEEKSVSILSTEHGILEKTNVKFHVDAEEGPIKEQRPGAAYLKLKHTLEAKIAKRRLEGLTSKDILPIEPEKEIIETVSDDSDFVPSEEDTENELSDEEQGSVVLKEADEQELNDDDDEEDESSSSSSEEDEEDQGEVDDENKKKGRILKAFEDSDEENDQNKMVPNFTVPGPSTDNVDDTDAIQLLWADSEPVDEPSKKPLDEKDEDDLLDLCSGVFSATQPPETNKQSESAIDGLITQPATQSVEDTELLELCSGTFATQAPAEEETPTEEVTETTAKVVKGKLLLDSDEDVDNAVEEEGGKRKKKKKRKQLQYSDDEDEESDAAPGDDDQHAIEPNEEDEQEAEVERFLDYDSEENEVEVNWTKKDKRLHAANFFENEAELSGSENSADENEQGMDEYDIELGDEEGFDQAKLQSDLERIHMRRMRDQDLREVKVLKEMFFEDKENDGQGRSRQFRWKHLDENGVEIEGGANGETGENDGQAGSDEENEEVWRKMRHERELFKIKSQSGNSDAKTTAEPTKEVVTPDSLIVKKRISIFKKTADTSLDRSANKVSPFLISKVDRIDVVRGSFLSRDSNILQKLADMTKNNEYLETANTVTSTNRLVFAGISPATAKLQSSKRASEESVKTDSKRKKLSY